MKFNVKFFADDTSLFTIVKDENESTNVLNNHLLLIPMWAYNWQKLFEPDLSKPAPEVLFSRKKKFPSNTTTGLNNIQIERASYQKHLGIQLDEKLNFRQHIDNAISKI